jgi:hypothetical protein
MLRPIIWRDLRWRVLAAILPLVPFVALVLTAYRAEHAGAPRTYVALLDSTWFQLPGGSAIFLLVAVIVGASGTFMRPRGDLAYLLSLPISRRRWLLTHVAASLAALALLIAVTAATFLAYAHAGERADVASMLVGRSLLVFLAASVWVGVTYAVLSIVRRPIIALVLTLTAVSLAPSSRFRMEIPAKSSAQVLSAWDPWAFADPRAWHAGVPLTSVLVALVLGLGGVAVAFARLERYDA